MKKAILLVGSILFILINSVPAFSQTNISNDYVVTSVGGVTDQTPYIAAMDVANWEAFRLQDQRFQMSFENGYAVELKSVTEMLNLGYPLNINNYQVNYPANKAHPTLELLVNNIIGIKVQNGPSKSY
jgi:hypothetical protein